MTEKKTFKNPWLSTFRNPSVLASLDDQVEGHTWQITISEGLGNPCGSFNSDEWDMEVTFTKKQPKPEVGGTCTLLGNQDVVYTILAVHEDLAWIKDMWVSHEDITGWVEPIAHLTDVKPWQPA